MGRHYKKPPVRPEVAKKWLQRHEDDGESIALIAKADGYDPRTVRRQLDLMREERENRESRQMVKRKALEGHYADLCAFAEKLKAEVSGKVPTIISTTLKEDPLYHALRQHLPRLSIWKDIEKLPNLTIEYETAKDKIKQHIISEARSRLPVEFVLEADTKGLLADGFDKASVEHLTAVACGEKGLEVAGYRRLKSKVGIRLERGPFGLAEVTDDNHAQQIEDLFNGLMVEPLNWEEYFDMKKYTEQYLKIKGEISDEMTKIMLRRVVPGRCTYCPI